MTLRTVTYDTATHKICPIEPSEEWRLKLAKGKCEWDTAFDVITDVIAAAPEYQEMKTYCLGYTHDKCMSCLHDANWHALNEMPDSDRLEWQKNMTRINSGKCRMTSMGEYAPVEKYQEPTKDE